jgi:hypothetical protein
MFAAPASGFRVSGDCQALRGHNGHQRRCARFLRACVARHNRHQCACPQRGHGQGTGVAGARQHCHDTTLRSPAESAGGESDI